MFVYTRNNPRTEQLNQALAQLSQLKAEFNQNEKSFHANSSGSNTGFLKPAKNGL